MQTFVIAGEGLRMVWNRSVELREWKSQILVRAEALAYGFCARSLCEVCFTRFEIATISVNNRFTNGPYVT